jgi:AcrR family transcriptional regulator
VSATARPEGVPYVELTRSLLRGRVLDSVGELLRARAWAQVTMTEVAIQAGVSRQTLYNAFGSRQDVAQAYVVREADRFLGAVDVAVREHASDPRAALEAALEIFLSAAGEHPLVRAITSTDGGEELLPLVTTRGGPLLERVTEHLTDLLLDTWPQLARADAAPVADALVRLAISYAALPSGDPGHTGSAVARILGPRIDELLG